MAGGREEAATEEAGPEAVGTPKEGGGEGKAEIENLKFTGSGSDGDNVGPTAGNEMEDDEEAEESARDVEKHLHDIGPDNGGHAAMEGVEEGEGDDDGNGSNFAGTEHDGDDERDGEDANTFGEGAKNQKRSGCEAADARTEAALHEFVGGKHLAPEILGQEEQSDDDAAEEITEDELEEAEVAAEGERRSADDGESTGFGGDDREGDSPPGSVATAEKVIFESRLFIFKLRAKPGDKNQVESDDRKVGGAHGKVDDSMQTGYRYPRYAYKGTTLGAVASYIAEMCCEHGGSSLYSGFRFRVKALNRCPLRGVRWNRHF